MENDKKYYAFISYKREDEEWAKWLQHKLEHYKLPVNLNGRSDLPKEIRPVFRDTSELNPGNLPQQIQNALEQSRYLIVICSPRSAKSEWVNREVEAFIGMGRIDKIIPFIIEGSVFSKDSETECFPKALRELPSEQEILGANINEMGRDAAVVKAVSFMFGLRFDDLWQRYEREKRKKRIITTIGVSALVLVALIISGWIWKQRTEIRREKWVKMENQAKYIAEKANELTNKGKSYEAQRILLEALPEDLENPNRPYITETEKALRYAVFHNTAQLGYVSDANFSSDGKKIILTSWDALKIWDAEKWQITRFLGYKHINVASFSPNNKNIVIGSDDGSIRIIDAENGNEVCKMEGHDDSVLSVAFSPDGKWLVSTSSLTLKVWDAENGKEQFELKNLDLPYDVRDAAQYCPDGKHILLVSNNEIRILDAADGKELQIYKVCENCFVSYSGYSIDGSLIFALTSDGTLHLWDSRDGKEFFKDFDKELSAFNFSQDGKRAAFARKSIIISRLDNGKGEIVIKGSEYRDDYDDYYCYGIVRFSPSGNRLLSITEDGIMDAFGGILNIWNIGISEYEMIGHSSWVNSVGFSPDGKWLVSTSHDNTIRIWDVEKGKEILQLSHPNVHSAIFSPDGRHILSGGYGSLILWDSEKGDVLYRFNDYTGWDGNYFDFSPNGDRIVATTKNGISIWDTETGEKIVDLKEDACCVGYNESGSQIISSCHDKEGVVWNAKNGGKKVCLTTKTILVMMVSLW